MQSGLEGLSRQGFMSFGRRAYVYHISQALAGKRGQIRKYSCLRMMLNEPCRSGAVQIYNGAENAAGALDPVGMPFAHQPGADDRCARNGA